MNENSFGMSGGEWIFGLIVLLALFNGGFGGFGNRGYAAEQPVTESGLCSAMNFNNLENAVGRMSDQQAAIARQTDNAICNLGYESLRNFSNLGTQLSECCCTTQRGIDSVNYNGAINTAAINANTSAGIQKVLDAISQSKIDALQSKVSALELQNAVCGVVRYPNGMTYNAGTSPFCGGNGYGCGCGVSV